MASTDGEADSGRRYRAVHGEPRRPGLSALGRLGDVLVTPLAASPRVFPHAFDAAVGRLAVDPWAPGYPVWASVIRLGEAARPTVAVERITMRLPDFLDDGRRVGWSGRSFLDAADWAEALMPVEQCHVYVEMHELVAADLDFRATRSYRKAKKAAQQGRPVNRNGRALATPDALKAYYRRYIDLLRSIRRHGLLDQEGQRSLRFGRASHGRARTLPHEIAERGVGVAVDADGSLVRHLGGRHRWGAVTALGLAEAPVEVRLVHVDWLKGVMAGTGLPAHRAVVEGLKGLSAIARPPGR